MEKPVFDNLLPILKNSCAHITTRISRLVLLLSPNKSATSIGVLAGLLVAFVITWKCLKAPSRCPSRPDRRTGARRINHSSQVDGDSTSLEKRNDSWLLASTKRLSLFQVVRKKLNGARKVTCSMPGIVLEELTSAELKMHAVIRPCAIDVLMEIVKVCDLYLFARVMDDESEERVLSALAATGIFTIASMSRHKVLFCSTELGRYSFVRQLEPDFHIDTNSEIISQLARYVPRQLHISSTAPGNIAANVFSSDALEHYFGSLRQTRHSV